MALKQADASSVEDVCLCSSPAWSLPTCADKSEMNLLRAEGLAPSRVVMDLG
jgi:hypothetical protein